MASVLDGPTIAHLESALLADEPDSASLQGELGRVLGLSPDDAGALLFAVVQQLNGAMFPPVTQLELVHTEGCNLACTYCFERDMLGQRRLSPEIARLAVDFLFSYSADEPLISITHFGGEPTLNFPGIRAATEYAELRALETGKRVRFDMTSNGVLLNEEMVGYFAEHQINVLLSIDGLEKSHDRYRVNKGGRGTFKQVIKALTILKQQQPWIGVKMTVMPENAAALYDDVLGLYDLGVNQFIIGHATGVEWSDDAMTRFASQLKALRDFYGREHREDLRIDEFEDSHEEAFFGCQAGRTSVAVSVAGELSPCSKIMGFDSKRLLCKLGDVWHGITHIKNRRELVGCGRVRSACERMGIAETYQGGCFAVNYGESGDLFLPSVVEHKMDMLKRASCVGCPGSRH